MSRAQEIADLLSGVTITTADNTSQLVLKSTDADATEGPRLDFHRDSGSPADGDVAGVIRFLGDDDGGNTVNMAELEITLDDITAGSDDATIKFHVMNAGTRRNNLKIGGTEVVINEDSRDIDFRVESDSDDTAFFVQGDTGDIGISTNSPSTFTAGAGMPTIALQGNSGSHTDRSGALCFISQDGSTSKTWMYMDTDMFIQTATTANMIFHTGNSEKARISSNSTPKFFVGCTTAPSSSVAGSMVSTVAVGSFTSFAGVTSQVSHAVFGNTNGIVGTITTLNSATAYNTSSDYRLKENVNYTWDATTRLKQLKPARFNFISDETNTLVDGFLAHEAQAVVPEAITGTKDETRTVANAILSSDGKLIGEDTTQDEWAAGKLATKDADGNDVDAIYPSDSTWTASHTEPVMQGIDQSKIVPLLVKTIQELESRIAALEAG